MILRLNNSKKDDYYKQTNNERDPFITCFPTSMINASRILINKNLISYPNNTTNYSQPEDQYDYFIHNDKEVYDFAKKNNQIVEGYDLREMYSVEEFAFNKWVGKKVCNLNLNITISEIVDVLNAGGAVVTSGKFCGFAHVVTIVGYERVIGDDYDTVKDVSSEEMLNNTPKEFDLANLVNVIIDDSYGDPRTGYKPVGVGGNDVVFRFRDFLSAINKGTNDSPKYFGITFDPRTLL